MEEARIIFHLENNETVFLDCEIAKTITQKMKGLMHRDKLDENRGMLFPFSYPWFRFFWMKNVKIPLDIIFVNRHMRIIKISEAPVEDRLINRQYYSHGLCKYVIESNMGFCKKNNIKKNIKIEIINK